MTRKRRVLAALTCFGLVAAACGGDDDSEDTEAPGSSAAGSATTTEGTGSGTTTEGTGSDTTSGETVDPSSIETDVGIDDETIKVGMLADLSGAFAPLVTEIVEAQRDYWENVNANGGIAGRDVELVVLDNAYDVPTQLERYEEIKDDVAILSQSTGSPHTAAIAEDLVDDNLLALPLSWYSGWADPELGANVFETYTSYCIESMNGMEWISKNREAKTVAIIGFPGEYGGDGTTGAKMAAEALDLEIVYDGSDDVIQPSAENANPDQSAVISRIVEEDPDLVWATINPTTLASIMIGADGQGYKGLWSGNSPTYSFKLLESPEIAPLLDESYIASTYIVTWGTDVPGMKDVVETMTELSPDLPVSDVYILGWTEAIATQTILEQAAANGDMTREGIVAAGNEVTVDFNGLAPSQTWSGEPNDHIVRESYIYDVVADQYDVKTLGEGGGSTGWELLEGPYTSDVAEESSFGGACYEATG